MARFNKAKNFAGKSYVVSEEVAELINSLSYDETNKTFGFTATDVAGDTATFAGANKAFADWITVVKTDVKADVIGTANDTAETDTILGAKKYAEEIVREVSTKAISVKAGDGIKIVTDETDVTKNIISTDIKLVKSDSTDYAAVYNLMLAIPKEDGQTEQQYVSAGEINIPRDMVATEGELVSADGNGNPGTFIKMTIANGAPFYIDVASLIKYNSYEDSDTISAIETGTHKYSFSVKNASIVTAKLADGSVTTAKLVDLSVTTGKLADLSVTTVKLVDKNVTTEKLADDSVTTVKLVDKNVTTEKLADASVTTEKLADASVTTVKLADASVTTLKLEDSIVTAEKLAGSSVTTDKIANLSVTTEKIADLSITTEKLAGSSVTTLELADLSVTAEKLNYSSVTSDKIANSSVITDKIAVSSVTTEKLADLSITTEKIAVSSVTTEKIAVSSVTTEKLADLSITSAKLANSSITTEKLADSVVSSLERADSALQSGASATNIKYKEEETSSSAEGGNTISVTVEDALDDIYTRIGEGGSVAGQIQTAIEKLDADLDAQGTPSNGGIFVVSGVTQVDGTITSVDSVEVEKAGAAAAAVKGAIEALDSDLDAQGTAVKEGIFVVSGVTQVDGTITSVDSVEVEKAGAAAAAIEALDSDLDASGTAAKEGIFVVSGITQVDGKITSVDSVEVEKAGAADAVKSELLGKETDEAGAATIAGANKAAAEVKTAVNGVAVAMYQQYVDFVQTAPGAPASVTFDGILVAMYDAGGAYVLADSVFYVEASGQTSVAIDFGEAHQERFVVIVTKPINVNA